MEEWKIVPKGIYSDLTTPLVFASYLESEKMRKKMLVVASLFLCVMLLSTMPVMAQQSNRLTFTLHAVGSSYIYWIDRFYNSTGIFDFGGTSMVEEYVGPPQPPFPAYTFEEGSVHAAGVLSVEWTTNDGSHHELRVSLFSVEETSGVYFMLEEADPTHPWGLCGWFQPIPLTYRGWHIHDGIKEKISGTASILAAPHLKAPDYSGTTVRKWWIIWTFLELDGYSVGIYFTELTIPHWYYGDGQYAYVPAAKVLIVEMRLI